MRVHACYPPVAGRRFRNPGMAGSPFRYPQMVTDQKKSTAAPAPAANIRKTEEGHVIEVALPGLTREQIQLELKDGLLTLQHIVTGEPNEQGKYIRREFDWTAFRRSFRLPETADTTRIEARLDAGILSVTIPARQPVVRPVTIQ